MKLFLATIGALLLAAPAFSLDDNILTFSLRESREQVAARMGPPASVMPSGEFESWQYQQGVEDHHEFSHQFLFRAGALISFTHNFESPVNLAPLFPEAESRTEHYPDAGHSRMSFRVRLLSGDRVLLALGDPSATQQLLLIRSSELPRFHPWLADRLTPPR